MSLLVTVGTVLTYNDTSVVNGQVYYHQISAINDVGEGNLSLMVSSTTFGGEEGVDNSMLILGTVSLLIVVAIIIMAYARKRKRK